MPLVEPSYPQRRDRIGATRAVCALTKATLPPTPIIPHRLWPGTFRTARGCGSHPVGETVCMGVIGQTLLAAAAKNQ